MPGVSSAAQTGGLCGRGVSCQQHGEIPFGECTRKHVSLSLSTFPSFSFPSTHHPLRFLSSLHHPPCFLSILSHLLPFTSSRTILFPFHSSALVLTAPSPLYPSHLLFSSFFSALLLRPPLPTCSQPSPFTSSRPSSTSPLLLLPPCLPSPLTTSPPLPLPWLPLPPPPLAP